MRSRERLAPHVGGDETRTNCGESMVTNDGISEDPGLGYRVTNSIAQRDLTSLIANRVVIRGDDPIP